MHTIHGNYEIRLRDGSITLEIPDDQHFNRHSWNTQRHNNAKYELHVILQGSCIVEIDDGKRLLDRQALLIAPGIFHSSRVIGESFERFTIGFLVTEGTIAEVFHRAVATCCVFSLCPELESCCRSILRECSGKHRFHAEMLQAQLTQLMIEILRLLPLPREGQKHIGLSAEKQRTTTIDDFFEAHYMEHEGKAELARRLNLSERQLTRVLQEHYGMSYREKITSYRMDHAAWMLRHTDKQIGEIAGSVGYLSENAFYRVFRGFFQMTPHQYRQNFKSAQTGKKQYLAPNKIE